MTQWAYDAADRVKTQTYPGGSGGQLGEVVAYGYGSRGLLQTITSTLASYVGGTTYNALGQVTERHLGSTSGVVRQSYAYSAGENFRLVSLNAGKTSPNYYDLQRLSYTYDDAGNVLTITDSGGLRRQPDAEPSPMTTWIACMTAR